MPQRDIETAGAATATAWGDWRLADLEQALGRVVRLLSPSAKVSWVCLYTPSTPEDPPAVHVAVDDATALHRARDAVAEGPQLAHFQSDLWDTGFRADVDDVFLSVRLFSEGEG